jgi:hypothetical protein
MALNYDKLVKFLKTNDEATQKEAADNQGLTIGQLSMMTFCKAKLDAGVVDKIPGTGASIKKARAGGDRWELIAVRSGKGVAEVKSLYEEAGGDVTEYVGRGRNFGATPSGKKTAAKGKAATKAAPKGKPGRPAGSKNKPIVRNRGRRAAGNPS